jgi:hypothetical protein
MTEINEEEFPVRDTREVTRADIAEAVEATNDRLTQSGPITLVVEFTCEFCGEKQTTPGALIFGPPNEKSQCAKWHICDECYGKVVPW